MWIKTELNILWEDRRHNPINLQGFKYDWLEENESNNEDSNEGDGEACDGVSGEHPVMDVVMQPDCLGKDKNGETIEAGLWATVWVCNTTVVSRWRHIAFSQGVKIKYYLYPENWVCLLRTLDPNIRWPFLLKGITVFKKGGDFLNKIGYRTTMSILLPRSFVMFELG